MKRILLAILSGSIITALVTLTVLIVNVGITEKFIFMWLKTWITGCLVSIPSILLLGPRIQMLVDHFFKQPKR